MAIIKNVEIHSCFITLGQFLKLIDLISSGGEFKSFIEENNIYVNDEKEDRRGRKMFKLDIIKINDETYKIC